ncbi:MAG: Nif3-like dinuclear metal center hexameric protein [Bacteroidota bacterium]
MQTKIDEVIQVLQAHAPVSWQEDYDNCGLLAGDNQTVITSILTCLDVTLEVVDEAIEKGANLIVAHHPIIYKPLKKLSSGGYVQNILLKAIKNDIAIYVIHTNLDNALHRGINETLAKVIGLKNGIILQQKAGLLVRLNCAISNMEATKLLPAFSLLQPHALAFQPANENFSSGQLTITLFNHQLNEAIQILDTALEKEIFKEITSLQSTSPLVGAGLVGYLEKPMHPLDFFNSLKERLSLKVIRHTFICKDKIQKVAICGGSGSFLLPDAIKSKADLFITADYKYHQFQEANNKIIIADIGHYESEVYAVNLIKEIISEKFTNFAVRSTTVVTNPVYYHQ